MRWVYFVTAPDRATADIWASKLDAFGISVIVVPANTTYHTGGSSAGWRLQVQDEDLEAARELIDGEYDPFSDS